MSIRARWAVAMMFVATAASVSNAFAQPKPGQGSIGARIGVPYFIADQDTRDGQRPRLLFLANFGYRFSPGWRLMTDFGFGWIGYRDEAPTPYKVVSRTDSVMVKQDLLTKIVPIDATLIKVLNPDAKKWSPYVGFGASIVRMEIVNQRRKIQDPATFANWVKWAPGVHAIVGQEFFMPSKRTVSLDFSVRWTYLFSQDTKRFPSGFTGNDSYLSGNFGVNVHFWPGSKPIETEQEPAPEPVPETLAPATPAPTDSLPPPAPTPPDTTSAPAPVPAPPDTTQRAPALGAAQSVLLRVPAAPPDAPDAPDAPKGEETFGAFGITVPRTEVEPEACAIKEKRTDR